MAAAGEGPCGAPAVAGCGSAKVSVRPPFCRTAARLPTACRIQPMCPSPVCNRTVAWVASSRNTAIPSVPRVMDASATVPTKIRSGCSCGGGGTRTAVTGALRTAGAGGRRAGENSGRSRVAVKTLNGTPHSGFPERAGGAGRGAAGIVAGGPARSSGPGSVLRSGMGFDVGVVAAMPAAAAQHRTVTRPNRRTD